MCEDGLSGILVEPTDLEGAAQAVIRLLKDKDLAEKIGRGGREAIRERFLNTRHMLEYLNLMLSL